KVVRYHLDPRPGALLRGSNRVFGAQDRQASRFSAVPVRSSRPVLPAQSLRSLTSHSQATAQGVLSESWGANHNAEDVSAGRCHDVVNDFWRCGQVDPRLRNPSRHEPLSGQIDDSESRRAAFPVAGSSHNAVQRIQAVDTLLTTGGAA